MYIFSLWDGWNVGIYLVIVSLIALFLLCLGLGLDNYYNFGILVWDNECYGIIIVVFVTNLKLMTESDEQYDVQDNDDQYDLQDNEDQNYDDDDDDVR